MKLPEASVRRLLGVFVVFRSLGSFGNLHVPDSTSWIDGLNLTKYPPSFAQLWIGLIPLFCPICLQHGRFKEIGVPESLWKLF